MAEDIKNYGAGWGDERVSRTVWTLDRTEMIQCIGFGAVLGVIGMGIVFFVMRNESDVAQAMKLAGIGFLIHILLISFIYLLVGGAFIPTSTVDPVYPDALG